MVIVAHNTYVWNQTKSSIKTTHISANIEACQKLIQSIEEPRRTTE